jgi:Dinitrogenase iron-molybdenum cofactor
MPGSIRVACASNGGEALHGHFGSARRFLICQVSAETQRLIDARPTDDSGAPAAEPVREAEGSRVTLVDRRGHCLQLYPGSRVRHPPAACGGLAR